MLMNKKILLLSLILYTFVIGQPENIAEGVNQSELNESVIAKRKMAEAIRLTDNAVKHIQSVSIEDACYDFIYNPLWRKSGDLYVTVYDEDGMCLAHGDEMFLIWKNIKSTRTFGSTPILEQMLRAGPKGKKLSYIWNNAYKFAYVRIADKDAVKYIVEVAFYPQDNQYITKEIVNSVKTYLNEYTKSITFSLINDPQGPFAKNDVTTMVYDFNGMCLANNQNPGLVNQNLLDQTDSNGVKIVREFLKIAQEKGHGWLNYSWQNAPTKAYVEKIRDPKTTNDPTGDQYYVVVSNYYPNQGLETAQNLVNRARSYLKNNGPEVAFRDFSNRIGKFVKGGLSIFAYDLKGTCLANWDDPSLVGQNLINRTDDEGKFITKEIINVAKTRGHGVVSYYINNSNSMSYIQLVHTPNGPFIIGCEFFPESKAAYIKTLVNKASDYLIENSIEEAFDKFTIKGSQFQKGDTAIFVYSTDGRRLVNGSMHEGIWRNFSKSTDQEGLPIIEDIISTALNGGGWIKYKIRNGTRRVYAKSATKPDKGGNPQTYIVGSAYFI